jgi:hypothetical protein
VHSGLPPSTPLARTNILTCILISCECEVCDVAVSGFTSRHDMRESMFPRVAVHTSRTSDTIDSIVCNRVVGNRRSDHRHMLPTSSTSHLLSWLVSSQISGLNPCMWWCMHGSGVQQYSVWNLRTELYSGLALSTPVTTIKMLVDVDRTRLCNHVRVWCVMSLLAVRHLGWAGGKACVGEQLV